MQRAFLAALVAGSYGLYAGALPWTTLPLLVLAALAVLSDYHLAFAWPRSSRLLDLACVMALAAIALQLIPLPRPVVDLLSPHADLVRSTIMLTPFVGERSILVPLTLDWMRTLNALGTLAIAVLAFWAARAVFSAGGGARRYCRLLALFGALVAVIAAVQRAVDPSLLLGSIRVEGDASPFGAFVNRNHFAGWLLMAVSASMGYLVAHFRIHVAGQRGWRRYIREVLNSGGLLTGACVFVMVAVLLLTLSRSAVAGAGAASLAAWLMARRRLDFEQRGALLLVALAGVVLIVVAGSIDLDGWAERFERTFTEASRPDNRLIIWRETLPMIRDFWLTGVGAGAYGVAILLYQQSRIWIPHLGGWSYFNQAHSHYLQIAAEGGLLLLVPAAAGLAALVIQGRRALEADRGEMFWVRVGAAAGLVGIAVQSAWDTPLVMPANAVLCATLMAALLHQRTSQVRSGSREDPGVDQPDSWAENQDAIE